MTQTEMKLEPMTIAEIVEFVGTVIPDGCGCKVSASNSGQVYFTGANDSACKAAKRAVGAALVELLGGIRKLTHRKVRGYRCWRLDFPCNDLFRCGIEIETTPEEHTAVLIGHHKTTRF